MLPRRVLLLRLAVVAALVAAHLDSTRAEDGAWGISDDRKAIDVSTAMLEATIRNGTVVSITGRDGAPGLFVDEPVSTAYPALRDVRGRTSAGPEARVGCRETTTSAVQSPETDASRPSTMGACGWICGGSLGS